MGKKIAVVDNSLDRNLYFKLHPLFAAHTGVWLPLLVGSVEEMVVKVIQEAGDQEIDSLLISGHGAPGVQAVGCGRDAFWGDDGKRSLKYDLNNEGVSALLGNADGLLRRLQGKLSRDAVITLGGCNVAKDEEGKKLLSLISYSTNSYVEGCDESQHILIPGWEGNLIRCYRNTHWVAKAKFRWFS